MPTVTLSYQNTAVQDTHVAQSAPLGNYGTSPSFAVSTNQEVYLKFDIGPIPNDVVIESAKLLLTNNGGGPTATFNILEILSPWDEATVTWNTKPSTIVHSTVQLSGLTVGATVEINVTQLVQKMVEVGGSRNGIGLTASSTVSFHARESSSPSYRPKLVITYSIPEIGKKQVEVADLSSQYSSNGALSHIIQLPANIKKNDLLVAYVATSGLTSMPTIDGWELIFSGASPIDSDRILSLYTRRATGDIGDQPLKLDLSVNTVCRGRTVAYRNAKRLTIIDSNITGDDKHAPLPVNNLPSSVLFTVISMFSNAKARDTGPKSFTNRANISGTPTLYVDDIYNYDKVDFSSAEMSSPTADSSFGSRQLTLYIEPIINDEPVISGQDEHLGSYTSPFTKEYSVTDTEDDPVTIVEKLDGVIINTKNISGLNTIDLTTKWDDLSYGKHTLTIEVNDSYDTTRKMVRTWTFLKVLPNNIDLIEIVSGLKDLENHIDHKRTNLISAVRNLGSNVSDEDTFDMIIKNIGTIKNVKWASGSGQKIGSGSERFVFPLNARPIAVYAKGNPISNKNLVMVLQDGTKVFNKFDTGVPSGTEGYILALDIVGNSIEITATNNGNDNYAKFTWEAICI